jgi:hypothetical protein
MRIEPDEQCEAASGLPRTTIHNERYTKPSVQAPQKKRWLELCEMAAKEFDPTKLLELTSEIDRLLAERTQQQTALTQPADRVQSWEFLGKRSRRSRIKV